MAQDITFTSGEVQLAGTLYLPDGSSPAPALVAVHGASDGTRDFFLFGHLASLLPRHGVAVLTYDRRGSGESSGDMTIAAYRDLAEDVSAALHYLAARDDIDSRRIGVWSFSQGGWIAAIAASCDPTVAFVVLISSSGVGPSEQMAYASAFQLREAGYGEIVVGHAIDVRKELEAAVLGRGDQAAALAKIDAVCHEPWFPLVFVPDPLNFANPALREELEFDPCLYFVTLTCPILLFYGETDRWVSIDESIRVWRECAAKAGNEDLMIVRLPGAGHCPTVEPKDAQTEEGAISQEYEMTLVAWLHERGVFG